MHQLQDNIITGRYIPSIFYIPLHVKLPGVLTQTKPSPQLSEPSVHSSIPNMYIDSDAIVSKWNLLEENLPLVAKNVIVMIVLN